MTRTTPPALSPAEAARVAVFDAAPVPDEVVAAGERVETTARELANHQGLRGPMDESRPDVWQNRCQCGWDDGDERPGWRDRYRLHVAAAAIAALPPSPAEEAVKALADELERDAGRNLARRDLASTYIGRTYRDAADRLRAALASPAPCRWHQNRCQTPSALCLLDCTALAPPAPAPAEGHRMLPGSHEQPGGPECRCGANWDRWNDRCTASSAPAPQTVTIDVADARAGEPEDYRAVPADVPEVLTGDAGRAAYPPAPAPQDRYWLCGDDCTTDCGACKGAGRPAPAPQGEDRTPLIVDPPRPRNYKPYA